MKLELQTTNDVNEPGSIRIFLCGDVMTGRGIDQILPYAGNPRIFEPYMSTATGYVRLAERKTGALPKPAAFSYIWGGILEQWGHMAPDVNIINLETAVTKSDDYWHGKGINYRMHPDNIACLNAASIDCCVLANNHVMDWGYDGLDETLTTLREAGIKTAGAGSNAAEAEAAAIMEVAGKGRVVVYSFGLPSSGIPHRWAASEYRPGINYLKDLSAASVQRIVQLVQHNRKARDICIVSLHWGGNWGYHVPLEQQQFAHQLIDVAGIDIVHGHSSHHPKAIEIYQGKPIIYGCGDFLNDYEGIKGYESYRDDLGLMYFVTMQSCSARLLHFELIATRIKHFRVNCASDDETLWLRDVLNREGKKFATKIDIEADNKMSVNLN